MKARNRRGGLARVLFLLWAALLAFGLPEVIAGTGELWLMRPDVWILGVPLYGLHLLLLADLALRMQRSSWPALYLLGIVFGLYESWITKVIWFGYPDMPGFSMGGFGPWIGVHETLGLVLFYHAVTSFLLPLAVLTWLLPEWRARFPAPRWLFAPDTWGRLRRWGLIALWGVISGNNMPDPGLYLATWAPLLLALWLGAAWLLRDTTPPQARNPLLGPRERSLAFVWLAAIYLVTYWMLLPERRPPVAIQLLTALAYPLLAIALWRSPRDGNMATTAPVRGSPRDVFAGVLLPIFVVGLAKIVVTAVSPPLGQGLAAVAFLAMPAIGVALFLWLGVISLFPESRRRWRRGLPDT